jgi:hypothetical protein
VKSKAASVGGLFHSPSRWPRFADDFNAIALMVLEAA